MKSTERSAIAAEKALLELISEGAKVSQHAVEKRAGLANGALNYNHSRYKEIKGRIAKSKEINSPALEVESKESKEQIRKERDLKNKYRKQRDELRDLLRISEGERLELVYQLYHIQKYLEHLERHGVVDKNVLEFNLKK
ncbi:hypothetical protein [Oceanimonas doudoroffii]|uniref:Uncharacterized protein n=1 Tax=Oceanimonas doudoroffii TaxID=84158 RepID=A0A233RD98_9GAMM|nr:hypothetical protein [Oceanimonas doudoroffii]OXY81364.1 hypothetical protein B6S08_12815 [Oceanimonas doudoroffii]